MKKYILALAATLCITTPTASLYAQPDETPAAIADAGEKAVAVPADAGVAAPATEAPAEPEKTPAEEAADDPLGTAGEIREAVESGNWAVAILLSLMILVWLLRLGAGKIKFLSFFKDKLGGYILVFTASTGGMLLTVLSAGGSLSFATVSEAIVLGFGAIGGWEAWKDIRSKEKPAKLAEA